MKWPWHRPAIAEEAPPLLSPELPLAPLRDLHDLRADVLLCLEFARELRGFLEEMDAHLERAQSARDTAERREHARQAFWHALAAREHAVGLGGDTDELATALLRSFAVSDPRADCDSRWMRPE